MASILEEAQEVIDGDRQEDYGDCRDTCERIAAVWSELVDHDFAPEDVPLFMAALKLVRESKNSKRDNLVDLAGYAEIRERVLGDKWVTKGTVGTRSVCWRCGGSGETRHPYGFAVAVRCRECKGSGVV